MRIGYTVLLATAIFLPAAPAASNEDFTFGVCRTEPARADWRDRCNVYLAGIVHALRATGHFCPDGKTSVLRVIALWREDLARDPDRGEIVQAEALIQTLRERGLSCTTTQTVNGPRT